MEMSDVYAACRNELIELAESISVTQAGAPLAATPPWTVLDGYRHLAGVCADFLDGRLDGAGSPEWTARQCGIPGMSISLSAEPILIESNLLWNPSGSSITS